ncbi:hypothetical protein C1645_812709 [Glomus cerebriforme]|uniref:DNA-directed DNA polymerase n=1 Tax=Glomus cerebriforme TaxID=658196 RepID=A0A397TJQ3_9GLOM|nr:hypothetical protein C1645_812709 [Glomus cerebriforme]
MFKIKERENCDENFFVNKKNKILKNEIPYRNEFLNILSNFKRKYFFPIDVEESIDFKRNYVLRLSRVLINGEKIVVNLSGIQVFTDVLIENKRTISNALMLVNDIDYEYEIVKEFPINGYNEVERDFLHLNFRNHFDRKNIGIIGDNYYLDYNDFIRCDDSESLKKKIKKLRPDVIVGFNDMGYDWPFILKKCQKKNLLCLFMKNIIYKELSEEQILRYYIREIRIKIIADNFMDVYYLKMSNLDGKVELSHIDLWKYYSDAKNRVSSENEARGNMGKIAKYYIANKRDILISMIQNKELDMGKYPGAYVYPPVKGLENKRPVTGLDFASLYPSVMMTYNISSHIRIPNFIQKKLFIRGMDMIKQGQSEFFRNTGNEIICYVEIDEYRE